MIAMADTRVLAYFNPRSPTDHYSLNLENPAEREVLNRLLCINAWDKVAMRLADMVDCSCLGTFDCIRNLVVDGIELDFTEDCVVPLDGIVDLDYVSPRNKDGEDSL